MMTVKEDVLDQLMDFMCGKRCRFEHDMNAYNPNDEEAYERMLTTKCAECSERVDELRKKMEANVCECDLIENAATICAVLDADSEGRVWRGEES